MACRSERERETHIHAFSRSLSTSITCFSSMSIMRWIFLAIIGFGHYSCSSDIDSLFDIQPQSVWINNIDEKYITSDKHYIGQVLYRYDRIEFGCDCQSLLNDVKYFIYWTLNDRTFNRFNNSNSFKLLIDHHTVQVPISYVTCYCVFLRNNSTRIRKDYRYQLYIDLESEPSLKPIEYSTESNVFKGRVYSFFHRHFLMIPILYSLVIVITVFVIIWALIHSQTDVALSRND